MFFPPDNFFYFITLFTLCVFAGTYLIYTYYINKLLIANALILFLCAVRIATEFHIQTLPSVEAVNHFMSIQGYGIPINILAALQWICVWFYVRPLAGWRFEKIVNYIYLFGFVLIPFLCHSWFMATGDIFYYAENRIDGYWKFTMNTDFWYYKFYNLHTKASLITVIIVLLVGVIRDKKNRLLKTLLLISYFVFPILFFSMNVPQKWNIPNSGILYTMHSLVISWYVSNYRLFKSNISLITKDLLNSISDYTISTNTDFKITNINNNTASLFEVKAKTIQQFLRKNIINKSIGITNLVDEIISTNSKKELLLKDKFGIEKTMRIKAEPYKNGDDLYGYTFLFTDLTVIRKNEEELQKLNTTKDRLFAIIGHDLRKPALEFRGIGQKIDYLLKKNQPEKLTKLATSLEQSAYSLNNLLDNLLNWARQQRSVISYNPTKVNVNQVIHSNFEFFETIAENKNIEMVNTISEDTVVTVDANSYSTIIRNLLDNAIKFSSAEGKIIISETHTKSNVTILIEDNGIGMNQQQLENLFILNNCKTTKGTLGETGSGLGLNLVNELVVLNKGKINVVSVLGEGTKFSITFTK